MNGCALPAADHSDARPPQWRDRVGLVGQPVRDRSRGFPELSGLQHAVQSGHRSLPRPVGRRGHDGSPEFIAAALPNGLPRCFGVSAVSIEGFESLWSPIVTRTRRGRMPATWCSTPDSNRMTRAGSASGTTSTTMAWPSRMNWSRPDSAPLPSEDFSIERDASDGSLLTPVRRAPRWRSMATHRSPT